MRRCVTVISRVRFLKVKVAEGQNEENRFCVISLIMLRRNGIEFYTNDLSSRSQAQVKVCVPVREYTEVLSSNGRQCLGFEFNLAQRISWIEGQGHMLRPDSVFLLTSSSIRSSLVIWIRGYIPIYLCIDVHLNDTSFSVNPCAIVPRSRLQMCKRSSVGSLPCMILFQIFEYNFRFPVANPHSL